MKPFTKKTLWNTAILTCGFSLVLLGVAVFARGDNTKLVILGAVAMGVVVAASALAWATQSDDSDDHQGKD